MNQATVLITGALTGIGQATDMLERFVGRNETNKARFLESIPAKRMAAVGEIAETIIFIASAKVPYITVQSIAVDVGYTAQ